MEHVATGCHAVTNTRPCMGCGKLVFGSDPYGVTKDGWWHLECLNPKGKPPVEDIALLVEQLAIANIKLFSVCDEKARLVREQSPDKDAMQKVLKQDIELCEQRSALRRCINAALGVMGGDTVKRYG